MLKEQELPIASRRISFKDYILIANIKSEE